MLRVAGGQSPWRVRHLGVPHLARKRACLPRKREKKRANRPKVFGFALPYPISGKVPAGRMGRPEGTPGLER